ncbi:MAG: ABC transporter substrate-binding protein, partial [Actinomycetota bacterium]|nr:ABC transporter substrate-binding protein [Actinomycetota bacterium]
HSAANAQSLGGGTSTSSQAISSSSDHSSGSAGSLTSDSGSLGSATGGAAVGPGANNPQAAGPGGTGSPFGATGGPPAGGNSTGVDADTIKIGIHVPMTGAAPVPTSSFNKGKDLYWRWLDQNDIGIGGRSVQVVAMNDGFDASRAASVCKEMVQKDHVFILIGFSGSDEETACARYAESVGVPYVSGGSTEAGLDTIPGYFTLWETYEQAAPLLAGEVVHDLGGRGVVNGMVRYDDPNLIGPRNAYVDSMRALGAKVQFERAITSESNTTDAAALAQELKQDNVQTVYMLVSPFFWLQVAHAAAQQGYHPTWLVMDEGEEQLLQGGCENNAIDNARALHMVPAYVDADKYDPDFHKAGGSDDIQWILWGLSKVIGKMLSLPGRNLTRERFVWYLERDHALSTGVVPQLSFTPQNHFGGQAMHLLRADCQAGHWVTQHAFASHL